MPCFAEEVGGVDTRDLREAPDGELASLAAAGDAAAFEALVDRHQGLMYAICRRITGEDEDAVDALQDALLAAWRGFGAFEGRSSVRTWLVRIATNSALDQARLRSQQRDRARAAAREQASPSGVESAVIARQSLAWALAQLPPPFRAAVVLRDLYDLTYQQIAAELGVPIDTVKSRISRGRQALAALLSPG
jgi:RNA polymerase sigma-70 factor, ECF subfamily